MHTTRTEPSHCPVWLLSLLVTVPSVHTTGVLTSAMHSKNRAWSLSLLVTVFSDYCHFWSLSLLVTITSGYCHLCTHHGGPDLGRAWPLSLLVTVPSGYCHLWLLSLPLTVTSVHTTGVLTSAVHTTRTEPGHYHIRLLSLLYSLRES